MTSLILHVADELAGSLTCWRMQVCPHFPLHMMPILHTGTGAPLCEQNVLLAGFCMILLYAGFGPVPACMHILVIMLAVHVLNLQRASGACTAAKRHRIKSTRCIFVHGCQLHSRAMWFSSCFVAPCTAPILAYRYLMLHCSFVVQHCPLSIMCNALCIFRGSTLCTHPCFVCPKLHAADVARAFLFPA